MTKVTGAIRDLPIEIDQWKRKQKNEQTEVTNNWMFPVGLNKERSPKC